MIHHCTFPMLTNKPSRSSHSGASFPKMQHFSVANRIFFFLMIYDTKCQRSAIIKRCVWVTQSKESRRSSSVSPLLLHIWGPEDTLTLRSPFLFSTVKDARASFPKKGTSLWVTPSKGRQHSQTSHWIWPGAGGRSGGLWDKGWRRRGWVTMEGSSGRGVQARAGLGCRRLPVRDSRRTRWSLGGWMRSPGTPERGGSCPGSLRWAPWSLCRPRSCPCLSQPVRRCQSGPESGAGSRRWGESGSRPLSRPRKCHLATFV